MLLLYGWCLVLNGLALAMRFRAAAAIVVLGLAAAGATASMARLLLRYRSRDARAGGSDPPRGREASRARRRGGSSGDAIDR